ncbi:cell wall metabolism sensor histidine kinase WalK [Nocardia sp. 348MFTsu5.1]|uniref:sensor histidine kinase n=1 Tax=Nocardia sp. 348MFTsu5.1 TaxID=1172185 RepID=UPI001E2C4412|nr:ATP-binding protein [Nocardia sp. 348MFTsu5.1]
MRVRMRRSYVRIRAVATSVRGRLTILATSLLALALALAAAIMLYVLYQSLLNSADAATSARAHEVATAIAAEGVAQLDDSSLVLSENLDVIQVIDTQGRVLVSNPSTHTSALTPPIEPGTQRTFDGACFPGCPTEYRATALGITTASGGVTVVVGTAEGPMIDVVVTVASLLCVLFPLILLMLIFVTYYFVGRALRPVEHIRAEVAEITHGDLSKRVPVPNTNDEISTLATTMNEMLDGLEDARLRQLRFVGDASHELRSPLMTLVGLLDLSRTTRDPIDPTTVEEILLPEAQRLQAMVADLLLLARADERGVPLRFVEVDLDEIVNREAERAEAITEHQVRVNITPVRVRGDIEMLTRAVRNLADNAVRHTRSTVTFDMSIDVDHAAGRISIIDDGSGIPDADKARVFDRFVRLDTDRERSSGGSGLGLPIVAEIVRAHHGSLNVSDTPGGGTTVTIALPIETD